ncbi:MAG TPA: XRE family transcriptional regulator [Geobacteraceae bacterium]|nr:XRE family transcriptional regulator [Geobacteraceae bacterium]
MINSLNIEKLNQKAEELGLNQSGIAKKLGVSREIVSQWFKNEKFPRPNKLLKLARLLDLSFSELVIKLPDSNEPVVAFRKKAGRKIQNEYLDHAKDMGRILAKLTSYLPFDDLSQPPYLRSPSSSYTYVQKAVKHVRTEIGIKDGEEVRFSNLIRFFNELHAVLIPVLWGSKENHENALHIYLPESMTTWIYLNLDCRVHDFKFWMAHELGHVYSPNLQGNEGEDFADSFAAAMLMPEEFAAAEYSSLRWIPNKGAQINRIKVVAEQLVVSPLTVYYEINKFAEHSGKEKIDLESGNEIHKATSNFNKQFNPLSECMFGTKNPSPARYVASAKEQFGSPFFDILREFISNKHKSASFIQSILNIPLLDAQNIYEELC